MDDGAKVVRFGSPRSPEHEEFVANVARAMALTPVLNRLTYADADRVRAVFEELTGRVVGDGFRLIPPFYSDCGRNLHLGQRVFINQNCTFYDLAEIRIGDDVMIGPNVSLITTGHPVAPSQRRAAVVARPIVIERGVWIAAGAIIIGGVTIGENSVIGAGAVVTRDIPANTLAAGNPARPIRSIADE